MDNIERIYREMKSKVKIGKNYTESLWTEDVKQGCVLSPLLFILFIADIEEYLRKTQEGGITIGNKRVYALAYADDLAIIAESKRNPKYTRKVSEEYSRIREMHTRLPGRRGDENRKDYCRGR